MVDGKSEAFLASVDSSSHFLDQKAVSKRIIANCKNEVQAPATDKTKCENIHFEG